MQAVAPVTAMAKCDAVKKVLYLFFEAMHRMSRETSIVADRGKGSIIRFPRYIPAIYAAEYVMHPLSIASVQ